MMILLANNFSYTNQCSYLNFICQTVNNRWRLNIYLIIGCRGLVAKYVETNRATNNTKLHYILIVPFGFGQMVKQNYTSLQTTRLSPSVTRPVEMSSFSLIQSTSRQCICKQLMQHQTERKANDPFKCVTVEYFLIITNSHVICNQGKLRRNSDFVY